MRSAVLADLLADVRFPAHRWQVVAAAEAHGVDARTRTKIDQIADREYSDLHEVMLAVFTTPAHLAERAQL